MSRGTDPSVPPLLMLLLAIVFGTIAEDRTLADCRLTDHLQIVELGEVLFHYLYDIGTLIRHQAYKALQLDHHS